MDSRRRCHSRLIFAKCSSFSAVGCAKAPAETIFPASRSHTNGAPKQYPVQARRVEPSSLPYFVRTASAHLGTFSVAKVKCFARQAAWSKPSGRGSFLLARYLLMGSCWWERRGI